MRTRIGRWTKPLIFEDDTKKTWRFSLLNTSLLASILLILLASIGNLLGSRVSIYSFPIYGLSFITFILLRHLLFSGRVELTGVLFIAFTFMLLAIYSLTLGTVRTPIMSFYVLLIIIAGFLFSKNGIVAIVTLNLLFVSILIYAENAKLLPLPNFTVSITLWFTFALLFGLVGGLTYFVYKTTIQALDQRSQEVLAHKRTVITLQQSEARFRHMFDLSPQSVLIIDLDGRIANANQKFCQITGYTLEELRRHTISELGFYSPENQIDFVQKLQSSRIIDGMEIDFHLKNGDIITALTHATFMELEDERFILAMFVDITERKQMEKELCQARDDAEAATRAKSAFLASMSHELRSPLNGVLGYAQLLQMDNRLVDDQLHDINVIYHSGQHLLNMINEILDLSKIEAGKMELQIEQLLLREMIEQIGGMLATKAADKQIDFSWKVNADVPNIITADPVRLQQILLNLLSNAIKFTDKGGVQCHIGLAEGEDIPSGKARIRFTVSDTGRGIAEKDIGKLFTPFEQIEARRGDAKGTGLGLAISRRLVELMNGRLQVNSRVNEGSTFWFELVVQAAVKTEMALPGQESRPIICGVGSPAPRILIVDDVSLNRDLLADVLTPLGFIIEQADGGQDAIEKVPIFQPHLIYMDLRMPQMDGFETTAVLRQLNLTPDPIIIAISASAFTEDKQKSLDAGCDAFLAKPMEVTPLLLQLEKLLGDGWEWQYPEEGDEEEIVAADTQAMILPPAEIAEAIYTAAIIGDIRAVHEHITKLEQMEAMYHPIAAQLARLAEQYQSQEIMDLLANR